MEVAETKNMEAEIKEGGTRPTTSPAFFEAGYPSDYPLLVRNPVAHQLSPRLLRQLVLPSLKINYRATNFFNSTLH
jgi:hypothetical protein